MNSSDEIYELEELQEDYELLVDIDEEEFRKKYAQVTEQMKASGSWYYLKNSFKGSLPLDFTNPQFDEVQGEKHLGLGRSSFYDQFLDEVSILCNHKVHQSDYMLWINPADPYESLNYYIDTAEAIEFSLEGVALEDIRKASAIGYRAPDRRELGTSYMTVWEINQILFSPAVEKTVFHLRGGLKGGDVRKVLGDLVGEDRIVEDELWDFEFRTERHKSLLTPKKYWPLENQPVIFLAGPLNSAPQWQRQASCMIFNRMKKVTVCSPRMISHEEQGCDYTFTRQRAWERYYMDRAAEYGTILFWMPEVDPQHDYKGLTYGATTRFELGEWMTRASLDKSINVEIGAQEGFNTIHTIAYDMQRLLPEKVLHTSLSSLVDAAIEHAGKKFTGRRVRNDNPGEIADLIPIRDKPRSAGRADPAGGV